MRIGLTGWASSVAGIVSQAQQAEAEGFSSLWLASGVTGDPLVPIAIAGRETSHIELGAAVLQTFPCHPLLQANRVASAANAIGRPGVALGLGPSHDAVVRDVYGLSYDHPGADTEEYLRIVVALLRGDTVDVDGEHWTTHSAGRMVAVEHHVPVLLAALGPRLLRVAGEVADGTLLWLANAKVIEEHVSPRIRSAANAAGRPAPRIVAGLPVAVHDDVAEARAAQAQQAALYASRPNFRAVVEMGGSSSPAEAAIVGNERSVTQQLQSLLDAGATEIHAAIFPVGAEPTGSLVRTRSLLASLVR